MKKIVLASASPRRKELLEQIGIFFEIQPAKGEEIITGNTPSQIVEELSCQKASEVAEKNREDGTLIIGSDTVVSYEDKIMGKPKDEEDAARMLRKLSGNVHHVYTGVTAILWENGQKRKVTFSEKTEVVFYSISEEEIKEYISTGEPMDKAGAYGIQGIGGKFIREIRGDYNNVVGFPVARLYQEVLKYYL